MYRGMIFDLDDTLYDYAECDRAASVRLENFCCEKFGIGKDVFRALYEKAKESVKARVGMTAASHNRILYMQALLEELDGKPLEMTLDLYNIYWDAMLDRMRLFPYVLPYFQYLRRNGIRIGILTDLTAYIQHRKLRVLGIAGYIDELVTSEEAGAEKPSAKMFELMLGKLALGPEEVCMIGDSGEKDIDGAQKSGIHGVLLTQEMRMDTECRILRKLMAEECDG